MGKMLGGGVESVVMNYYRHIDHSQVQFDFLVDADSTAVPQEEIEAMGGRVLRVPPYQRVHEYLPAMVSLFKENCYRVVHSHVNAVSVLPLMAARLAGVPVRIAHNHSTSGKGEPLKNAAKYALRPFATLFPTHCLACSDYAARWLFGTDMFERGSVQVLPNAVELDTFAFDAGVREHTRSGLGVSNSFVVGHVGRFVHSKNHAFLIDVFSAVKELAPDAVLVLIGDGPLRNETELRVARMGLSESVRFLGMRSDVSALYQAMDVLVLPSFYEGFPVVCVEAQASGLCVIASDLITPEVRLTDVITFVSLREAPVVWARAATATRGVRSRYDDGIRSASSEFDIANSALRLQRLYVDAVEEL